MNSKKLGNWKNKALIEAFFKGGGVGQDPKRRGVRAFYSCHVLPTLLGLGLRGGDCPKQDMTLKQISRCLFATYSSKNCPGRPCPSWYEGGDLDGGSIRTCHGRAPKLKKEMAGYREEHRPASPIHEGSLRFQLASPFLRYQDRLPACIRHERTCLFRPL